MKLKINTPLINGEYVKLQNRKEIQHFFSAISDNELQNYIDTAVDLNNLYSNYYFQFFDSFNDFRYYILFKTFEIKKNILLRELISNSLKKKYNLDDITPYFKDGMLLNSEDENDFYVMIQIFKDTTLDDMLKYSNL